MGASTRIYNVKDNSSEVQCKENTKISNLADHEVKNDETGLQEKLTTR